MKPAEKIVILREKQTVWVVVSFFTSSILVVWRTAGKNMFALIVTLLDALIGIPLEKGRMMINNLFQNFFCTSKGVFLSIYKKVLSDHSVILPGKRETFRKITGAVKRGEMHCIVLYCIVLYCIVLYCIVLWCDVLSPPHEDYLFVRVVDDRYVPLCGATVDHCGVLAHEWNLWTSKQNKTIKQ